MDTVRPTPTEGIDGTHAPRARRLVFGLVLWSLFVWATRIDNIVSDQALDGAAQAWRLGLALSFVLPALVTAVLWWRHPRQAAAARSAIVLATWTIVVWVVRGAGIALGDHAGAFIAVHLVLAVVSIALAASVLRAVAGGVAFPLRRSPH